MRVLGLDIGTTSIGWAVIDYDQAGDSGQILGMGSRIFPEARDPDGTPLNQTRRLKRMMRRQLRRRKQRRRDLNEFLAQSGLLPAYDSPEWNEIMAMEPLTLRDRGLTEPLSPHELGRALYHLAKRRHFKGRDLDEEDGEEAADEKEAKNIRDSTLKALRASGKTLGQHLHAMPVGTRRRGVHANRASVMEEYSSLVKAQTPYHAALGNAEFQSELRTVIFSQNPVFWRTNTLGDCRYMPGEPLCPKGSWLSQQRRMLEKLNNLEIADGNMRPLDAAERGAILQKLQVQASMSWAGVRAALKPLFKAHGEAGREKSLRFNLELGGESKLLGNAVEAKLSEVFGEEWCVQPHKRTIRNAIHQRLWEADYGKVGRQRVVILNEAQRRQRRAEASQSFVTDFGISQEQAAALVEFKLPTGWEPFSIAALEAFLPRLEEGIRFGALTNGPDWQVWRQETFPNREQPTGEILNRLPSPTDKDEQKRITALRNPTVVRTQNELRKIVNNLIDLFKGKPDLIRVELARDVGKSKREREEMQMGRRKQEKRRKDAATDLRSKGIEPARRDIEKWMLWKESAERCPYTGDQIGFDALFRNGEFEVEHIWPRSRSLDDSIRNKTLCRRDVNGAKGNKTPYEHFQHREDEWNAIINRLNGMIAPKGGPGMSPGKVRRFLAQSMPDDFASRQLNDTGYAARQAVGFLKRLWPDVGPEAPVTVQPVSGRVTAQLRKGWGLNNILSDDGEKTRADHRHHAVDALVVACTHPGMTNQLSRYLQDKDDPAVQRPLLLPPWENIRRDADAAVAKIVVSHRVRKKVSGPLHKETTYGDTGEEVTTNNGTYRLFVTKKKVESLSRGELDDIRDKGTRNIVKQWVENHGDDPKKAFATYPMRGGSGPEIRKVRLTGPQKMRSMVQLTTGYAATGNNHHIAIYRSQSGKMEAEVVSLYEAAKRVARRESVIQRDGPDGAQFIMSLSLGDTFYVPDGDRKGYWTVKSISGNGQIFSKPINNADPSAAGLWGPSPAPLIKLGAKKVSIDPVGRIRPAND